MPDKPAADATEAADMRHAKTATTTAVHSTKPRLRRSRHQRCADYSRRRQGGEFLVDHVCPPRWTISPSTI
jgi:hypothetical protein